MSDQVKKSRNGKVNTKTDRKKRPWLRRALWFLLAIIVLAILFAVIAWIKRYDLMEQQAREIFERAGIEAELEIESVTGTEAIINDLSLSHQGRGFASVDQLKLVYTLEKVRAGEFEQILLKAPKLSLTLNENGTLIDKWLPESSNDDGPVSFPNKGIFVEDGAVEWTAPFGDGSANVDATINSPGQWRAKIKTGSVEFRDEDIDAELDFDGELKRINEHELNISGDLSARDIRVRFSRADEINANIDLVLKTEPAHDDLQFSGRVHAIMKNTILPSFSAGHIDGMYVFDGRLDDSRATFTNTKVDWKVNSQNLSLTDADLRTRLVHKTMSYDALTNTPIVRFFADHFAQSGKNFLQDFSFNGEGEYVHDENGYVVDFDGNAILTSGVQTIRLMPGADHEIDFARTDNNIDIHMDIDWLGPRNLYFSGFKMKGASKNGLLLTAVKQVDTRVGSDRAWATTRSGEIYQLSPFDLNLGYARKKDRGTLNLVGGVKYDGRLPGGRATGFESGGRLRLDLLDGNFKMAFAPSSPVQMTEFISDTGWRAENVTFQIADASDVLAKSTNSRPLNIDLINISAGLISPEDDRHLAARFGKMRVQSDFLRTPQLWHMDIEDIEIRSEDFPSPGTHILSPIGSAKVFQYPDGHIEFDIDSPSTRIETENAVIQDLSIQIAGLPDDFSAEYVAGKVKLKGSDMPELPMRGTGRLANGELTGSAVAHLPESKDTPINIEYRSIEGVGSANIKMPKIVFEPRGLQPQYVIPALRGRIAEVSGEASAEFEFAFSGGGPVSSFGSTKLKNLQVGTLVGPITGVNANLIFKSIFPLETNGVQTATLSGFDPGFPLENGTVKFELVPEGVRIDQAVWPVSSDEFGPGQIYIDPLLWRFGNVENNAVVNVDNLSLGNLVAGIGNRNLSATGQINGQLPVSVNGVDVRVNSGILSVKEGGVIKYKNQGIDTFAPETKGSNPLGIQLEGAETGFAFKALENFEYRELEAKIDGPLDGEMSLRMAFDGKNAEVLAGTQFKFNVSIAGELANIIRSTAKAFSSQNHIEKLIELNNESGKNDDDQ